VWATDVDARAVRRDSRRDAMRYLQPRDESERAVLVLDRPAVLVQRTTAPEQPRRLLAAALDDQTLAAWGGQVIVENHVNVLTCDGRKTPLTLRILVALLHSTALDRVYRCITGSVAVSAYELAALPLPGPEVLRSWNSLDENGLNAAISRVYGLQV
jgi:adenine-specific DNA-methyltransferase